MHSLPILGNCWASIVFGLETSVSPIRNFLRLTFVFGRGAQRLVYVHYHWIDVYTFRAQSMDECNIRTLQHVHIPVELSKEARQVRQKA